MGGGHAPGWFFNGWRDSAGDRWWSKAVAGGGQMLPVCIPVFCGFALGEGVRTGSENWVPSPASTCESARPVAAVCRTICLLSAYPSFCVSRLSGQCDWSLTGSHNASRFERAGRLSCTPLRQRRLGGPGTQIGKAGKAGIALAAARAPWYFLFAMGWRVDTCRNTATLSVTGVLPWLEHRSPPLIGSAT